MKKLKAKIIRRQIEGKEVEIRKYHFPVNLKIRAEEKDRWIVEGYASIFGTINSYNEIIEKGAFAEFLAKYPPDAETGIRRYPKFVAFHDWESPLGPTLEAREDEIGLFVRGELLKDVQKAREMKALIEAKAITDLSFGFFIDDGDFDENGIYHVRRASIYEWSPVLVGAEKKAIITQLRSEGQEIPEDVDVEDELEDNPDDNGGELAGAATEKGDDSKTLSAKNRGLVEEAIGAVQKLQNALEALLEAAENSLPATGGKPAVDSRDSRVRLILRDAQRADKATEKVIVRAKQLLNKK